MMSNIAFHFYFIVDPYFSKKVINLFVIFQVNDICDAVMDVPQFHGGDDDISLNESKNLLSVVDNIVTEEENHELSVDDINFVKTKDPVNLIKDLPLYPLNGIIR